MPYKEKAEPKRIKPRKEIELPTVTLSSSDRQLPRRLIPNTLQDDPSLEKLRIDKLEPHAM